MGKLKRIIREEVDRLNENFRTIDPGMMFQKMIAKKYNSGGNRTPDHYRPPEVDPHDPKYHGTHINGFERSMFENTEQNKLNITEEAFTVVNTNDLMKLAESTVSEMWDARSDGWYFGDLPLYTDNDKPSWDGILNELAEHGPKSPVAVVVESDGTATVFEDYGVYAYKMLGIRQIPVHVMWQSDVGGTERDPLNEYHRRARLPRNANNLQQYFDETDGMWFRSDREKINWVAGGKNDMPLSPKQAYETGNYKTRDNL